jgi:hypothetical protein
VIPIVFGPLGDIEELSSVNMESLMREIETDSDGYDREESGGESGSIASSQISQALGGSSVGHYSNVGISESGEPSSGEIFDSPSPGEDDSDL